MIRRLLPVLALACLGCHGIEHATRPTAPSAGAELPTSIALVASRSTLPAGGGSIDISVAVLAGAGGVDAARVTFSASAGALGAQAATTDVTGHTTVSWQGTETGTITARVGDVIGRVTIYVTASDTPPRPPTPGPEPGPTPDPEPPAPGPGGITVGIAAETAPAWAEDPIQFRAAIRVALPLVAVTSIVWSFDGQPGGSSGTWTYPTGGSHTASVRVTGADGRWAEASIRVQVRAVDDFDVTGLLAAPRTVVVGADVAWTVTVVTHRGQPIPGARYQWAFGNGSDGVTDSPTTTTFYGTPGEHTARVTVRAPDGRTGTATGSVTVEALRKEIR
ncbi:MAG: PKD domain-containing protein [Acidobacteriota bacterium]